MPEPADLSIWTSLGLVAFFIIKGLTVVFFGGWALKKLLGRSRRPSQQLHK